MSLKLSIRGFSPVNSELTSQKWSKDQPLLYSFSTGWSAILVLDLHYHQNCRRPEPREEYYKATVLTVALHSRMIIIYDLTSLINNNYDFNYAH
jgi:hypothetical protein